MAWILMLWGIFSCFVAMYTESDSFKHPYDFDYVHGIATLLYAICCLAGGFTGVFRLALLTRIFLMGAGFCVVVLAGVNIPIWLGVRPDLMQPVLEWTVEYLFGAAVLFSLGYWLGRK